MERVFERVHTVTDYFDRPRAGVADFNGVPHYFRAVFNEDADDWEEGLYELSPLPPEAVALALEDWEIWLRWRAAFDRAEAGLETHPALPQDSARHVEITETSKHTLVIRPNDLRLAEGTFRPRVPTDKRITNGIPGTFEVRWTPRV